jgi:hypothetical protein
MQKFTIPKDPSDEDYYAVRIDPEWVGESGISEATVTVKSESELEVEDITVVDNYIRWKLKAGIKGIHLIEITVTSAGRIRQRSMGITVEES